MASRKDYGMYAQIPVPRDVITQVGKITMFNAMIDYTLRDIIHLLLKSERGVTSQKMYGVQTIQLMDWTKRLLREHFGTGDRYQRYIQWEADYKEHWTKEPQDFIHSLWPSTEDTIKFYKKTPAKPMIVERTKPINMEYLAQVVNLFSALTMDIKYIFISLTF